MNEGSKVDGMWMTIFAATVGFIFQGWVAYQELDGPPPKEKPDPTNFIVTRALMGFVVFCLAWGAAALAMGAWRWIAER